MKVFRTRFCVKVAMAVSSVLVLYYIVSYNKGSRSEATISDETLPVATIRTPTQASSVRPSNTQDRTHPPRPPKGGVKVVNHSLKQVPDSQLVILSAYRDNRSSYHGEAVVILGYQSRGMWNKPYRCSIEYSNGRRECLHRPSIVEMADNCNKYLHYTAKTPVVHICRLSSHKTDNSALSLPVFVSLSIKQDCSKGSPKQLIENRVVDNESSERSEFGVCLQTPLYGKESLQNIYEFIEVHLLLGIKSFTFYTQIKVEEFERALRIYKDVDIELVRWPNAFKFSYPVHYYGEVLVIHDCLYRNRNRTKYLGFVDLDEVITPLLDTTWAGMFGRLPAASNIIGYTFDNALMVNYNTVSATEIATMQKGLCDRVQVPKYLKVSKRFACTYAHPRRSKFIVLPEKTTHLDIHSICRKGDSLKTIFVPHNISLLFHYRKSVLNDCENRLHIDAKQFSDRKNELLAQMSENIC